MSALGLYRARGHGIAPGDLAHCRAVIRTGSLSFHTASRVLPAAVRDPALALYAFCRLSDDEVDEGGNKAQAVLGLGRRLDAVYAGAPGDTPEDRAFAAIVARYKMPRALPEALLEGLAWDAEERRYESLADLNAYSARVASAVGAMMCVLMGVRDAHALARACDLGVAMQLTNIARDVGEDARAGRIYLPLQWLREAGIDPEAFMADPTPRPEIRAMVARLLREARKLYLRSEAGVPRLPRRARTGIYAARFIYAGIGAELRRQGHDSITLRARTGKLQKLGWLGKSAAYAAGSALMPQPATLFAPPLPETAFLVDAVAERDGRAPGWGIGRTGALLQTLADLKAQDAMGGQQGRRA
ncbi:15-cis-phytoene synthase [Roseovarius nanhaiticus]|uniref:15-cis-phytoene synthase n=1 Tax=Roseovarius nanhaiticus TaxID=573024 RepID=UPI0024907B54|nr:phytoene/squalene synthase family protein [Roseovarius nanhaiticus]